MCARCSHARLGPRDHHHAKGDAFVQVPLLDGRCEANDSHQQESGVFAILCGHLNKHKSIFSLITSKWPFFFNVCFRGNRPLVCLI